MAGAEADQRLTIGGLASACGAGQGTIHHYQKIGLLQKPEKPKNGGFRSYSQSDVQRLLLIKNAQALGFSLKEIGTLLTYHANGDCQAIRHLLSEKAKIIQREIQVLKDSFLHISQVTECCSSSCTQEACHLFSALSSTPVQEAH